MNDETYMALLTGLQCAENANALTFDQAYAARLELDRIIELAEPIIA